MVAVLCMVLAAMLSGQTFISLMDRIDHAHNHAHFANALAGSVAYSVVQDDSTDRLHHHHGDGDLAEHDAHGSDRQVQSDNPAKHSHSDVADHHVQSSDAHHHSHDSADHQHGPAAALVFLAVQSFVLPASPVPAFRYETTSAKLVSFNPRGPDHPPKTGPEIRV